MSVLGRLLGWFRGRPCFPYPDPQGTFYEVSSEDGQRTSAIYIHEGRLVFRGALPARDVARIMADVVQMPSPRPPIVPLLRITDGDMSVTIGEDMDGETVFSGNVEVDESVEKLFMHFRAWRMIDDDR